MVWNFYNTHERDFSWRRTRNPYHILVSEIMLQQTQTERVKKKYEEFISLFPTLHHLARAPLHTVLYAWQGLGYNRRALFLKHTAEIVDKQYHGHIPRDEKTLRTLPGIGKGTAGALCAFAFGIPTVFIETNIRRVYIRHFFTKRKNISDTEILRCVEKTVDIKNPRDWYYALMDYGSFLGRAEKKNPNIRSMHYQKQSPFKGSERELRGKILKAIVASRNNAPIVISKKIKVPVASVKRVLLALRKEGFL